MKIVFGILITATSIFLIYCLIPTLYYKWFNTPAFLRRNTGKNLLLSFDDGPDPRYTIELLKLLEDNNIHVVFFVVAEKAKQNPEIIRRIKDGGHVVALHSLEHKNAWLKGPFYQKRDFENSLAILDKLGCGVDFYRAPWGHLTLTSLFLARKHHLKIILWTVMAQDWEASSTPQRVLDRLLKRTKPGSVICLHDSGCGKGAAEGAPENTIKALRIFIPRMLESGWTFAVPKREVHSE